MSVCLGRIDSKTTERIVIKLRMGNEKNPRK